MRIGVHPNALTLLATVFAMLAAYFIARGQLPLAGWTLLLSQPLDALDGALARRSGRISPFGAVLDSTSDRVVDATILGAIGYHLAESGRLGWLPLALVALIGSLLVSYVRARAEGVGLPTRSGVFTRLERVAIILLALLFPALLLPALGLLAVGTVLTLVQRLRAVQSLAKASMNEEVGDGIS